MNASPWWEGIIVTAAMRSSAHASTPCASSSRATKTPLLVRICCLGSTVMSGVKATMLLVRRARESSMMRSQRSASIKLG